MCKPLVAKLRPASLLITLHHARPNDLQFVHWPILAIRLHQSHPLNHSHAALNPTEDSVLAIEPWGGRKGDEELTTVRVGAAIRHAENASTGVLEVVANLVFEFLAVDRASSSTGAGRITSLDHEVWDDAVEDDVIVVTSLRESREVVASLDI